MNQPNLDENKRTSLQGKYHLSGKFLKIFGPIYLVALVLFSYGEDMFGSNFTETYKTLAFGLFMLCNGILIAANVSIWEKSKSYN